MPALPDPISSTNSPRQVFATFFKAGGSELPIRGGWGYTRDDPVIIERNDSSIPNGVPFDGVGVEYAFVEKRIYAEMIFMRPPGDRFAGIDWKLLRQQLMSLGSRHFDALEFEITAFTERDWNILQSGRLDFQEAGNLRAQRSVRFNREFWFDITSFYGRH